MVFAPQVRLAGPRLDARLAAGEDPFSSAALALRASQLAARRLRGQLARGLDHALSDHSRVGPSAAVAVDSRAVEIARPALEQLAEALRARERVAVRGVALTHLLLTTPGSALYESRYPEELYEQAWEALLEL